MALEQFVGRLASNAGNFYAFGTAAPSGTDPAPAGGWKVGDIIINTGSTGPALWRCVTAGATGTAVFAGISGGDMTRSTSSNNSAIIQSDSFVEIDTTGGAVSVRLPSPGTIGAKSFRFKRVGGNNATLLGGAAALDAGNNAVLATDKAGCIVQSDGTQYWLVATMGTVSVT